MHIFFGTEYIFFCSKAKMLVLSKIYFSLDLNAFDLDQFKILLLILYNTMTTTAFIKHLGKRRKCNFFYSFKEKLHCLSSIENNLLQMLSMNFANMNNLHELALKKYENIFATGKKLFSKMYFVLLLDYFLENKTYHLQLLLGKAFNPFPEKPWFLRICSTSILKTPKEKEKLLITSNFIFSHSVFKPIKITSCHFHQI